MNPSVREKIREIIKSSDIWFWAEHVCSEHQVEQLLDALAPLILEEISPKGIYDIAQEGIYRNCNMQMRVDMEGASNYIAKEIKSRFGVRKVVLPKLMPSGIYGRGWHDYEVELKILNPHLTEGEK